jgi:acyl carrier protein
MKDTASLVRGVLAQHTGRTRAGVRLSHHLEQDLDLSPLEVMLIAEEIEDMIEVELSAERLESVVTVRDLLTLVTGGRRRGRAPVTATSRRVKYATTRPLSRVGG